MYEQFSALIAQVTEPGLSNSAVLQEALRISGIALAGIFFVMGLFGGMISLFSLLFPASEDDASQ